MKLRLVGVLVCLAILWFPGAATGQIWGGEIAGRVTDGSARGIADATVTVTGDPLISPRRGVTTISGRFSFAAVPPGRYLVRIERSGAIVAEQEVEVTLGARLELTLMDGAAREAAITGDRAGPSGAGVASLGATFTRASMDRLATPRDPWGIIDLAPGVLMDNVTPGGAMGRTQPSWAARGTADSPLWNVDGATWTDLAAQSSPLYYDLDLIEQIRVQTAGHDASIQTGGTNINIVTRGGGNHFRGDARLIWSGRALEAGNLTAGQRADLVGAGDPLVFSSDVAAQIGGPIRRDRAWFFVSQSWSRSEHGLFEMPKDWTSDRYDPDTLYRERAKVDNSSLKLELRPKRAQSLTVFLTASNRSTNPQSPTTYVSPETWYFRHGSAPAVRISHEFTAGRLLVGSHVSYADGGYVWDFQSPDQSAIQPAMDLPSTGLSRSNRRLDFIRRMAEVKADGAWLVSRQPGLDHALRFGLRLRRDWDGERSHVGGFATANFWKGFPTSATLYRDGDEHHHQQAWSAYLTDTIPLGRVTIVGGMRIDHQSDSADRSSAPANPIVPEWLPAFEFPGISAGVTFLDVAPRATLTWDVTGGGRTVARLHLGQYYGAGIDVSRRLDPSGLVSVTIPWSDGNRDRFVQRAELHPEVYLPSAFPAPPQTATEDRVDPDLVNNRTTELLAGVEYEIKQGLTFGATYIWRRADRLQTLWQNGVRSSDYVPVTITFDYFEGSGLTGPQMVTYYDLPFEPPAGSVVTNLDAHTTHHGLELSLRARTAPGLRLDAALTLNDTRLHYHGENSYQDPTRIPFEDNAQYGSMNARWSLRTTAVATLPWDVSTSLILKGRQGYPLVKSVLVPYRQHTGSVVVPLEPIGTTRHDNMWTADWRIEKTLRLGPARLVAGFDVFNVTNTATPTRRETSQNEWGAGRILEVTPPRIARVGVRIEFR